MYFGDTGRFPYGPKPAEEVLAHALEITDVLLDRDVKLLVVACNSAAAAALDTLQAKLDIPVIGVIEPGLRAAARVTRTGRIGVIGTVGTIASGAYQRLADDMAAGAVVRSTSPAPRVPASWSSSRPATSTPTRCTCSPSVCSRRSGMRPSTHWCWDVRTTRCSPVPSAT